MTVQENHIYKILSAKCKVVCEADKLLSKLNYGDDIDCCSNKLISAVQLINRLECYCFTPDITLNTPAKFSLTIDESISASSTVVSFYKNNIQLTTSGYGPEEMFLYQVIVDVLNSININFVYNKIGSSYKFDLSLPCDTFSFEITQKIDKATYNYSFTLTQEGICVNGTPTVICSNCFPESDLPKMYAVLNTLLS